MKYILLPSLVLTLATGSACIIDTVPMPEGDPRDNAATPTGRAGETPSAEPPTEEPDREQTDLAQAINPSAIFYSTSPIYLVGTAGATSGSGTLTIQPEGGQIVELIPAANGSFSQALDMGLHQTLLLTFTDDDGFSSSLSLELSPASVDANSGTEELRGLDNDSLIVTRDTSESVRISGESGTLALGLSVLASNPHNQDTVAVEVQASGSFKLILKARAGDPIILFVVESASSHGGGAPIELIAP